MSNIHIIFYVIKVCQRISTYFSYRITCRHTDAFWLSDCQYATSKALMFTKQYQLRNLAMY